MFCTKNIIVCGTEVERQKHEGNSEDTRGGGGSAFELMDKKQTLVFSESLPDCLLELCPQFSLTLGTSSLTFLLKANITVEERKK